LYFSCHELVPLFTLLKRYDGDGHLGRAQSSARSGSLLASRITVEHQHNPGKVVRGDKPKAIHVMVQHGPDGATSTVVLTTVDESRPRSGPWPPSPPVSGWRIPTLL
jgi:hypothetical protein